jgi:GAF domain-containing protein
LELREEYKGYLVESWSEQLKKKSYAFLYQGNDVKPIDNYSLSGQDAQKTTTLGDYHPLTQRTTHDTKYELVIPIELYSNQLGILQLSREKEAGPWKENEISMLKKSADQIALALENARLLIEIKKRATRDRVLGDVTSKIRETLDIQTVLETATKEIFNALDMETVTITLSDEDTPLPVETSRINDLNDNGVKE